MEKQIRNIGWFIKDPERKSWPTTTTTLRKETNQQLLDKVCRMFCNESAKWYEKGVQFGPESFKNVIERVQNMRLYRNELMHAAYVELKGGDKIYGLLKSGIKKVKDKSTIESELLTESSIDAKMQNVALISFDLNLHYVQLIHSFDSD
ncbi:hypothetical protein [Parafilimonas sp.]|uniref:hypothetical protein n=1 Tax=Parafilimonas sp. TaxID=1969739 RepID=UPI0039E6C624